MPAPPAPLRRYALVDVDAYYCACTARASGFPTPSWRAPRWWRCPTTTAASSPAAGRRPGSGSRGARRGSGSGTPPRVWASSPARPTTSSTGPCPTGSWSSCAPCPPSWRPTRSTRPSSGCGRPARTPWPGRAGGSARAAHRGAARRGQRTARPRRARARPGRHGRPAGPADASRDALQPGHHPLGRADAGPRLRGAAASHPTWRRRSWGPGERTGSKPQRSRTASEGRLPGSTSASTVAQPWACAHSRTAASASVR